jgi:hypothetical protein
MALNEWAMGQLRAEGCTEEEARLYEHVFDVFAKQGHSGFSASYLLSYLRHYEEKGYEEVKSKLDKMLSSTDPDDDCMQGLITKDILDIINLFREYGFDKDKIHKMLRLMDWKPILPVTGAEEEWSEASDWEDGKITQQNKVCSAIFRDNRDNTTAHYLYGKVFSDNGGHSWFTGRRGEMRSSIPVTFPFYVPDKPEYIYLNGEGSDEVITDPTQIKELYDEWDREHTEKYM